LTDVFAVDAYATVAKEKHGYNMEQVLCALIIVAQRNGSPCNVLLHEI